MTVEEFAEITRRVISRDGFATYQPTVCIPGRRPVLVIEGVPPVPDLETALLEWCRDNAGEEECLVAFKVSDQAFKVVRRDGETVESDVFAATT
jgi:hypothetical protein